MKSKLLVVAVIATFLSACGPTIYMGPNLESSKARMKTLAILPFSITIDSKRLPKGTTPETLKQSEEKTGYDIQNNCYTWLLQKIDKFSVTFQDVDRTNALLKKANLSYDDIALQDKAELCKLLGVDGVISGKAALSKPMSEGGAIAMAVLVGFYGSTNKINATLTIHDTKGELLWKYDYELNGSLGSSPQSMANGIMNSSARKFPYRVK